MNPSKSEVSHLPGDTNVSFLPMERIGEQGDLSLEERRPIEQVKQGFTYFRDGDVIVAKITPCFENGKGALCDGLVNGIGFGTTELHVLRVGKDADPTFIAYITRSTEFRSIGTATMYGAAGQQRVPEIFIANFQIAFPPLPEQRAIAAFLDRETAKLDTLIAKKERLIELLHEQRSALISHAVTRGLDPAAPLKDSGIDPVGVVPDHWQVVRNKTIFHEINERSTTGSEELLTVSHITGVTPRKEKEVNMFMAESLEGYKLCEPGDFVINTMWAWMGAAGISRYQGIVSPSYNVYRLRDQFTEQYDTEYLDMLYRTPPYICEINRHSTGVWTSRLRLYPEAFLNMYTLTPPIEEQRQIVQQFLSEFKKVDVFVGRLKQSIERLREYRTALISAAVTGKIDIRNEGATQAHEPQ
jgi:type I restriction enzyme S subunit